MRPRHLIAFAATGLLALVSPAGATDSPTPTSPLPWVEGYSTESRVEPRFSRIVSSIATPPGSELRSVQVRCWSETDWKALSQWYVSQGRRPLIYPVTVRGERTTGRVRARYGPEGYVQVAPSTCQTLARWSYRSNHVLGTSYNAKIELAGAIQTLAHEAVHARPDITELVKTLGVEEEAIAECYGVQQLRPAARILGFSPTAGRELAWLYYHNTYRNQMPAEYRSRQCKNSGSLDLSPGRTSWP